MLFYSLNVETFIIHILSRSAKIKSCLYNKKSRKLKRHKVDRQLLNLQLCDVIWLEVKIFLVKFQNNVKTVRRTAF